MIRVEMLATGDEVLHGQIVDTNAAWLAERLFSEGLPMSSRMTVGDRLEELVAALQQRSQIADVLIVNGGLGPTSDDLSSLAAATAAGVRLQLHPQWLKTMEAWFAARGRVMAAANRKQAEIPENAEMLDNPIGTACGFALQLNRCWVFFTPGVPSEFKMMVDQQIIPRIRERFSPDPAPVCLRLTTFGRGESSLASELEGLTLPQGAVMGYRSSMPIIELKLTGPAAAAEQMAAVWSEVQRIAGDSLLYEGTTPLPSRLAAALTARQLTLSLCESYTAGLLSWHLTSAGTPVCDARVSPALDDSPAHMAASGGNGQLALVVGPLRADDTIAFLLRTPQGSFYQRVTLNLAHYGLSVRQETVAMTAMNMLRRWLAGEPATGGYGWVGVVEEQRL
ncbi:competence/damage-inducible protein A [Erwinia sp. OLTSP20]|uniref:nicotinamide mononucleotide deamidase-related protein YfaY n=1 Tax=unclassified Erwinia TaxID=2622719 RepID=UPI000C196FC1|nr:MULTISPECIES: nicotinamide mononucleotide deamidase-related protein YfaY [unclassified Erwinia]PIJ50087.1 competence/damage-inducible protein A [Erwinia sp. OAMSP11]PIJ71957.1 competence/damage-inducible protein A [Erwinia sp. OLSSP12]PIJ80939.1 competence/damage-inducible protein A [Erwinia sp. OLCASP19]PIJ83844.1 competence/damage-inducible protein A [Erwinia sp. OLMTSP26]PIJ86002.1 competence/damage-inducible protein A [Erwinia sp. OLMDSP33]